MSDAPTPREDRWPARLLSAAGVAVLLLMVGATLIAVVARYFGLTGLEWSYEIAGIAFLWVTFLGALVAELRHENVAFEVIKRAMSERWQRSLDVLSVLLLGLVGAVLLASGIAMLARSGLVPTPLLRWPGFVSGATAPVLAAGLFALAAMRLWARFRRPPSPKPRADR